MSHWSRAYLGIPYVDRGRTRTGVDCWGLVVLAYADLLGVALPTYDEAHVSAAEAEQAEALFRGELSHWRAVEPGAEREHDLLWFRDPAHRLATHVGLAVRPGLMIHASRSAGLVRVDDYDRGAWSRLLIGVRRHAA